MRLKSLLSILLSFLCEQPCRADVIRSFLVLARGTSQNEMGVQGFLQIYTSSQRRVKFNLNFPDKRLWRQQVMQMYEQGWGKGKSFVWVPTKLLIVAMPVLQNREGCESVNRLPVG